MASRESSSTVATGAGPRVGRSRCEPSIRSPVATVTEIVSDARYATGFGLSVRLVVVVPFATSTVTEVERLVARVESPE